MLRLKLIVVLLSICVHPSSQSPSPSPRRAACVNPAAKYGHCIPLDSCPHLLSILTQVPINRESVKFLQKSTCGFITGDEGQVPKVCCVQSDEDGDGHGSDSSNSETPSPRPRPRPRPTPGEKPSYPIKVPIDANPTIQTLSLIPSRVDEAEIERHPNLRLLPNEKTCGLSSALDRVVGGEFTGLGTYPWMVLLGILDIEGEIQYACGGTLISRRYVLTAAHCVTQLPLGYKLAVVRIGEYDQTQEVDCTSDPNPEERICAPSARNIQVQQIIVHERYDKKRGSKENDIALLRLRQEVTFGPFVGPVCLPRKSATPTQLASKANEINLHGLLVSGWGLTESGQENGSPILKHVQVPLVSYDACNAFYKNRVGGVDIGEGRFCAGGEKNKDSCKGDSGGPVMGSLTIVAYQQRTYQFGIVSIGPPSCAGENEPALYTRVSHYMPWILDHLKP